MKSGRPDVLRRSITSLAGTLAVVLGWSAGVPSRAQTPEFQIQTWHLEDGLPDGRITALAEAPDGCLWIGTPSGAARFDGARFKRLEGLPDPAIAGLTADPGGSLWLAGKSGTVVREGGDIYVNEGVPEMAVSAYQRALAKDGESADLSVALRNVEVLVGRSAYTEAGSLLTRVKEVCGKKLGTTEKKRVLKLEARIAAAAGQSGAEQARLLEDIVALDPLDGEALLLLAQHYARNTDTDKACFLCERAAGIEKYEAEAKLRHGQILVKNGKYQEALPLLKRALELKPREDVQRYVEQVERAARSKNG